MNHPKPGITQPFIDFTDVYDDDGFAEPSISPVQDGEFLRATTVGDALRRPPDVLRRRTEVLRAFADDMLWMRDADRVLGLFTPATNTSATWNGTVAAGGDGKFTLSNDLWIGPFLTPGKDTNTPPVASPFGSTTLLRADSAALIVVTSKVHSYAGGDKITLEVKSGAALTFTDTDGHLVLVAPVGTTRDQALAAMGGSTYVNVVATGGTAGADLIMIPQARQRVPGNFDGEVHVITAANLAAFFADPANVLRDGDTIAIWYASLVEASPNTGGRRQAMPENGNTSVPAGGLFNSRVYPDKLNNAIPIAKVMGGKLIFIDGTGLPKGATVVVGGGGSAGTITYDGGPNWVDSTTNPSTTVELQLDKIVTDLTAQADPLHDGAAKIGTAAIAGTELGAGSIRSQLNTLALITGMANWADGTANPDTTRLMQIKKIIADLADLTGASCGSSRIGSESIDQMPAGTVRDQLTYLLRDRVPGDVAPNLYAYASGDKQVTVRPFSAVINGVNRSIAVDSVVDFTGKTAATWYSVYAYWNGASIALEALSTTPDVFTRTSSADPTRTYLFAVRTCPTNDKIRTFIRRGRRTLYPMQQDYTASPLSVAYSYIHLGGGSPFVYSSGGPPQLVPLVTQVPPWVDSARLYVSFILSGVLPALWQVRSTGQFGASTGSYVGGDMLQTLFDAGWHQTNGGTVELSVPTGSGTLYLGVAEYED